jgi:glycosyltransferase involved in cell wall biosynthesis
VVSVHGGDLLSPLLAGHGADVLRAARVVIANSRGMLERAAALAGSAERMRVIHPPGEPPPAEAPPKHGEPTIATLANLDPRKRHVDVLEALARIPDARWVVIGDGPERDALQQRAAELGLAGRVEWTGALAPPEAIARLARCHVMAMPSVDEAFGVAYTEAIACGLTAIGCAGEPGPEELAELTDAMVLVPPRDPEALAEALGRALTAPPPAGTNPFTLEACGTRTLEAYRDALA